MAMVVAPAEVELGDARRATLCEQDGDEDRLQLQVAQRRPKNMGFPATKLRQRPAIPPLRAPTCRRRHDSDLCKLYRKTNK